MFKKIQKAIFMILELALRMTINPFWRAGLLRLCGAKIGKNVRIYETQFINLEEGFSHLSVEDDVHVGTGCLLDLKGTIFIGHGATISPNVTILTHVDPGSYHGAPLCRIYPPKVAGVKILPDCWIGVNTTILAGSNINETTVVGACSLVTGELDKHSLYVGQPATKKKDLLVPPLQP